MNYRLLGQTGIHVSPICLGTMMFGSMTEEREATEIIHLADEMGINFLDTANVYNQGESERIVGRAIADRRERFVLATKGRQKMGERPNEIGASRLHLIRALEESLRRLGTDYVDIYYCHAPDYNTPIEETLRALDDVIRQGKVRYAACSNFRAWRLCESLWVSDRCNLNRFACTQPLYNIVNRDIEVELLPLCREHRIGVVSYSPLARGILTGKYRPGETPAAGTRAARNDPRMMQAEWREASLVLAQQLHERCQASGISTSQFSLAWCLANPILTSVIVGPRTMDQFKDNCGCLELAITAEDEAFVDSLVPPGDHSGHGYQDSAYPITGRPHA